MILASEYDFVEIDCPGAIHHRTGGFFTSTGSLPTYEDAALMREIYWTAKLADSYTIYARGDRYTATPPLRKDTVGMMPTRERWRDDLAEVRDIIGQSGKGIVYGFQGATIKSWHRPITDTKNPPEDPYTANDIMSRYLTDRTGPSIPTPADGMISTIATRGAWDRVARIMLNYDRLWPCRFGMIMPTNKTWIEDGVFGNFLNVSSAYWEKDGQPVGTGPAYTFLTLWESRYSPGVYVKSTRTDLSGTWARECDLSYTVAAYPWTHRRIDFDNLFFCPVFRIRMCPCWKFIETEHGYESAGHHDAKFHERIYCPALIHPLNPVRVPPGGGEVSMVYADGTNVASMCDWVVNKVGATGWAATAPYDTPPSGWTASRDGYEIVVDVVAMLICRNSLTRDFVS